MTRKHTFIVALIAVELACVVCGYFAELWQGVYLYPAAESFWGYLQDSWGLIVLLFMPLDVFLFLLLKFFHRKEVLFRVLKGVSIIVVALSILLFPAGFSLVKMGVWHSQTNDVSHYGEVDSSLQQVFLDDIDIGAFLRANSGEVLTYQYYCRSIVAMTYFDIYSVVHMEPDAYFALKNEYSANDAWQLESCAEFQTPSGTVQVDGVWKITPAKTNIDKIQTLSVAFCDESNTVYIWLNGDCYT